MAGYLFPSGVGCFLTHKHPSANHHGTAVGRPALLSWTVAGASDLLGASSPFLTQDPVLVLPVGGSSPSPQADPQSWEQTLVLAPARAPNAPSRSQLCPGRPTRSPRRHSPDSTCFVPGMPRSPPSGSGSEPPHPRIRVPWTPHMKAGHFLCAALEAPPPSIC